MSNFKKPRIRDDNYKRYIRDIECLACGNEPCEAAHIRWGNEGGTGLKPSDDLINPLCHSCHAEQTIWPLGEADWWMTRVIKPQARKRYQEWFNTGK